MSTIKCRKCGSALQINKEGKVTCSSCGTENICDAPSLLKAGHQALTNQDWGLALVYFSHVIEMDPENADAYLNQVYASFQVRNQKEFGDKRLAMTEEAEKEEHMLFISEADIYAFAAENSINPNEALEMEIPPFVYYTTLKSREEQFQAEQNFFDTDPRMVNAVKFSKKGEAASINILKMIIYAEMKKRIAKAKDEDEAATEKAKVEFAAKKEDIFRQMISNLKKSEPEAPAEETSEEENAVTEETAAEPVAEPVAEPEPEITEPAVEAEPEATAEPEEPVSEAPIAPINDDDEESLAEAMNTEVVKSEPAKSEPEEDAYSWDLPKESSLLRKDVPEEEDGDSEEETAPEESAEEEPKSNERPGEVTIAAPGEEPVQEEPDEVVVDSGITFDVEMDVPHDADDIEKKYQDACYYLRYRRFGSSGPTKLYHIFTELGDYKDSKEKLVEVKAIMFQRKSELNKLKDKKRDILNEFAKLSLLQNKRKKELEKELEQVNVEIDELDKEVKQYPSPDKS